jgi:hypothetical protein
MAKRVLPRFLIVRHFKKGPSYYWIPPKRLMHLYDLLPMRLAEGDGLLATAIVEAEAYNRQLDAARERAQILPPEKIKGTLPWLYEQFKLSTKYTAVAEKTRDFYDHNFKIIRAWSEKARHPPVAALTRELCLGFYELLCRPDPETEEVMFRRAKAVMTALRRILKHAVDLGIIKVNPATAMELVTPRPREAIWTDAQIAAFIAMAIEKKRPSLALAVRLAGDIGPRRGDITRLPPTAYSNGIFTFRPRKSRREKSGYQGKIVQVRALPELRRMMQDYAAKPSENMTPAAILVNETTGLPYVEDTFSHDFREIADSCPGLRWTDGTPLLFMDLRRTAVINLARAGCTVPEICAITGHSKKTVHDILETYLPTDQQVADNAITKLEAHRAREERDG